MRCPDCNRFVGIEQADPELNLELSDGSLTGNCRLLLTCAECGTELAETTPDVEIDLPEIKHNEGCKATEDALELTEQEAENTDRFEGKGRYAKHFYGADIRAKVACDCGVEVEVTGNVEEQASYFDQLN